MLRFKTALISALVVSTLAGSASAATLVNFSFAGASATYSPVSPYIQTANGLTLTARAFGYSSSPSALESSAVGSNLATLLATLTPLPVRRTTSAGGAGLGVCPPGEASNQCNQVDADGANELLFVSLSNPNHVLKEATFSRVDFNDTLKLFGVKSNGEIEHLGFGGKFDGAGVGTSFAGITGVQIGGSGDDQRYRVNFNTARYAGFIFANNNDAADGYRLDSLTLAAVPEPATWATMLIGFFGAGALLRGRRREESVAALG